MTKNDNKQGRQTLVATKVSHEAWLRLNDIASRLGLTPYRLVQEAVDTLILYMDEGRQLQPDMQQMIDCFEQFEGWGSVSRLTDINVRWQVMDSLYFLYDSRESGAAGLTACWCKSGLMGRKDCTFNKVQILDAVIRRLFPDLWRRLSSVGMQADTHTAVETIRHCLHEIEQDADSECIREMFADCGRTEYGRPSDLVKYVRHNRKNVDAKSHDRRLVQTDMLQELFGVTEEDGGSDKKESTGNTTIDNTQIHTDYEQG